MAIDIIDPNRLPRQALSAMVYDKVLFHKVSDATEITVTNTNTAAPTPIGPEFNMTFPLEGTAEFLFHQAKVFGGGSTGGVIAPFVTIGAAVYPFWSGRDSTTIAWMPAWYVRQGKTAIIYPGYDDIWAIVADSSYGHSATPRTLSLDVETAGLAGLTKAVRFGAVVNEAAVVAVLKGNEMPTVFGHRIGTPAY